MAQAAFERGARAVAHGLNAHKPLSARDPEPLGIALAREDAVVMVTADGVHLHPSNLAIAQRAAPRPTGSLR